MNEQFPEETFEPKDGGLAEDQASSAITDVAPTEPITPIGDQVQADTSERPIPIPVGGEPTTEVPVVDYGRIHDPEKAWDVAHASKETLEEAAENKNTADILKRGLALADDRRESGEPTIPPLEDDGFQEIRDLDDKNSTPFTGILRGQQSAEALTDADMVTERAALNNHIAKAERKAEWLIDEAEVLEDWAGILYDHPVSEAYKAAHSNIEFTPNFLLYMQRELVTLDARMGEIEESIDDLSPTAGVEGISRGRDESRNRHPITGQFPEKPRVTTRSILEQLSGRTLEEYEELKESGKLLEGKIDPGAAELTDRYFELIDNPDTTTLADLNKIFVDAYKKLHLEPITNEYNARKKILDDVKSGKASE